ncbi:MAG: helix-turn-helix transcriptional regulator [Clostridia bacterium]|nr:helix-turn-helix transcriptional regulator [Clostridia bacterium]
MDEKTIRDKRAKEIGKKIYSVRNFLGISREKLAEKSNISTNFLYEIEIGKKVPNVIIFSNICDSLGISSDKILNPDLANQLDDFINDISIDFYKLTEKDKSLIKNIIHFMARENE